MNKYLLIILPVLAGLLLPACHQKENTGAWQNAKIDTVIKAQMAAQNQKLLKALIAKDAATVKQMASQKLTGAMGSKLDTLVNKADLTDIGDYSVLDEFYVKNADPNTPDTVFSAHGDHNDYSVTYMAVNPQSYVSVFVSKKYTLNSMVLAVYSKYGDDWKLDNLHVGEYSILVKTAGDWYAEAMKLYEKGSIVSALNKIFMTFDVAHPGGALLHYKDSSGMKTFVNKLLTTANSQYHFPIIVNQVKTKPQIFAVDPKFTATATIKGVFPVIKYQSAIAVKDTLALKAENLAMRKVIGSIFKGIDTDESIILYRAYNQLPNSKNDAPFHGFVQKVK